MHHEHAGGRHDFDRVQVAAAARPVVGHLEHSKCQWSHPGKIIYFVLWIFLKDGGESTAYFIS
jgi:hypothetical protein